MAPLRRLGLSVVKAGLAAHVWLYRRTDGRRGGRIGGTPVLLLTTTGRRSGAPRTRPVGFPPESERFVVCGSNGGSDTMPAWALNLRHNPSATVEVTGTTVPVTAREVTAQEYQRRWHAITTAYPRFAGVEHKTQRVLPIFVLEPDPSPPA